MNEIVEDDSFYSFSEKRADSMYFSCYTNGGNVMEMRYSDGGENVKNIKINGSYVGVDVLDSEYEIKEHLSDTISFICEALGKSYENVLIKKYFDLYKNDKSCVDVYIYNKENTGLSPLLDDISTASEYIRLEFVNSSLKKIVYHETFVDYDKYYRQCGEYDLLTLDEAEEMLEKGYVFGFHACRLCAREQTGVDFTNYDYVTIVYRTGNNGLILPFYAFYENIDKLFNIPSYMHAYAMTLVLALDIDGIDEYFEKQAQNHKSSQGGSDTLFLYNLRKSETEENCYYGYDTDGDVCRVYYEGNDVIDGQDYYVFINLFRNLDYPGGAPSDDLPLYEANAVGVHPMEENE